jgi:hypothetical protein
MKMDDPEPAVGGGECALAALTGRMQLFDRRASLTVLGA